MDDSRPMSAHGHAAAEPHAAGHEHHYEGIPADRPAPDEPVTPIWLPLVGISLVLATILGFILTRPEAKTREQLAPAAEVAAAAPTPPAGDPPPAQPERRAPRALPSGFRPGALPSGFPFPRGAGSARPGSPGPFAMPGGSGTPIRRRPPAPAPAPAQ